MICGLPAKYSAICTCHLCSLAPSGLVEPNWQLKVSRLHPYSINFRGHLPNVIVLLQKSSAGLFTVILSWLWTHEPNVRELLCSDWSMATFQMCEFPHLAHGICDVLYSILLYELLIISMCACFSKHYRPASALSLACTNKIDQGDNNACHAAV